ncbi:hypothetical protein [Ulvibacterium sp.]|uniref:hypothetical protein n=1 Tax=Ulvibacterium sp. TaxID=2665914 RepID=UPI003CC604C4
MEAIINRIDGELLNSVSSTVHHYFGTVTILENFVFQQNDLGGRLRYNNLVPERENYLTGITTYLRELGRLGKLNVFLQAFFNEMNNRNNLENDDIVFLKSQLEKFLLFEPGLVIQGFNPHVFNRMITEFGMPFLDRRDFRDKIRDSLIDNGSSVIFVRGKPRSGMSYLKEYLESIKGVIPGLELYHLDASYYLDNENLDKGLLLAKYLGERFKLTINWDEYADPKLKFVQFVSFLKSKIEEKNTIPVIFLHDFHVVTNLLDNAHMFMYELVETFVTNFPKAILIIAGYPCEKLRNWRRLVRKVKVYEMENINPNDLLLIAAKIYDEYQSLHHFNREEFVNNFVNQLPPLSEGISEIGLYIEEFIDKVKP